MLSAMLKRYYDRNTWLFLALGSSRKIKTIHRAVWLPGVRNRDEALDSVHHLVADQARALNTAEPHLLDLGCGVGGSLFSLARKLPIGWTGSGVTLSSVQVTMAREFSKKLGLDETIAFIETDFLNLPHLRPVDAAYAIESYVLNANSEGFFASVHKALKLGGLLMIVDDFLSNQGAAPRLSGRERRWLETFRQGWHAAGLDTVLRAVSSAQAAGFALCADTDLSAYVHVNTMRDRFVKLAVFIGRMLRLRGPYWDSLYGGNALHDCLHHGLTEYRFLVFRKQ